MRLSSRISGLSLVCALFYSGLFASPVFANAPTLQFLEGFAFKWDFTPHRLRQMGVILPTHLASSAAKKGEMQMIGGTWSTGEEASDKIHYQLQLNEVQTDALQVIGGQSGDMELYGQNPGGSNEIIAANTQQITLDKARLGLPKDRPVTVVLQGFSLDTAKTHTMGYTLRELGLGLQNIKTEGDKIRFQVAARLRADATLDRPVVLQNLQRYGATARIHYAVVSGSELKIQPYRLLTQQTLPGGSNPKHVLASPDTRRVQLPAIAQDWLSWPTLTGFLLQLNPKHQAPAGRYLRAFGILTEAYTPGPKGTNLLLQPHFSNAGMVSFPTEMRLETQGQILQLPGHLGTLTPHHLQGIMQTGQQQVP